MKGKKKTYCGVCGDYLFNKLPFAKYCKSCGKVAVLIGKVKPPIKERLMRYFPKYEFKITIKFKKKETR